MKSVLISIKPKWCELIAKGKKTVEIRKTSPKIDVPFKCYIYMSKGQRELLDVWKKGDLIWDDIYYEQDKPQFVKGGYKYEHTPYFQKVIGEFVCNNIDTYTYDYCDGVDIDDDTLLDTMLDRSEINLYAKGKALYGWHISNLVIYDNPRELSEFKHWETWKQGKTTVSVVPMKRPPQSWCYVEAI